MYKRDKLEAMKVVELRILFKKLAIRKYNGKTVSRLNKRDLIDAISKAKSPKNPDTKESLESMKVPELKKLFKDLGIHRYKNKPLSRLRKSELIDAIHSSKIDGVLFKPFKASNHGIMEKYFPPISKYHKQSPIN
jgi:rRNA pseudouridine-1189 N-methylase Emg1 (Nep1/Mra1 family)